MSAVNASAAKVRRTNGHAHSVECICPLCGAKIDDPAKAASVLGAQRALELEIEQTVSTRFQRQLADVEARKKTEISRAVREATRTLKDNQAGVVAAAVEAERQKGGKATAEAVAAARIEHAAEKARLEAALTELQQKLAARPAHQIGEPAEQNLHAQIERLLAEHAPSDVVARVGRGQRGADVVVTVTTERSETAGTIIIDSKAHRRWQTAFVRKISEDRLRDNAAFAILSLSPSAFPADREQIAVIDGVILAAPERVPTLVLILRQVVLDNFIQKLGATRSSRKADRLYQFILSPACEAMLTGLEKLARDLAALDQVETKSHQTVWAKRAALVQGVAAIREQLARTIADIVAGGDSA